MACTNHGPEMSGPISDASIESIIQKNKHKARNSIEMKKILEMDF